MRILLVFEPGVDGVFRLVEQLSRFLAGRGHDLCVAYSSLRDSEGLYCFLDWLESKHIPSVDLRTGSFPSVRDIGSAKKLRNAIRTFQPDVIHAHSSKAGALVRLFSNPTAPVAYTPHAYFGLRGGNSPLNSVFNSVEKLLAGRSTNVHGSPGETQFAQTKLGINPDLAVEIPNPVDFDRFRPPSSRDEKLTIKKSLGIEPDALVIGTVGRICYQKNPEFLYQAFAKLNEISPGKVSLLHVGNGKKKDEKRLSELADGLGIKDRITRPEYRTDPSEFYQAMDVFALTSRYEGMPVTALEALASNLPLVVCDTPGSRAFGNYGLSHVFVAENENLADYVAKLESSLQSLNDAVKNRELAKQHFSIESCCGRVESLYQELTTSMAN